MELFTLLAELLKKLCASLKTPIVESYASFAAYDSTIVLIPFFIFLLWGLIFNDGIFGKKSFPQK